MESDCFSRYLLLLYIAHMFLETWCWVPSSYSLAPGIHLNPSSYLISWVTVIGLNEGLTLTSNRRYKKKPIRVLKRKFSHLSLKPFKHTLPAAPQWGRFWQALHTWKEDQPRDTQERWRKKLLRPYKFPLWFMPTWLEFSVFMQPKYSNTACVDTSM